jgi:hypothetical protein
MIETAARLKRVDDPYTYFTADGVIPPEGLAVLNKDVPRLDLYSREIKVGEQHRKQYNMWRCEPALDSKRTGVADELPVPWSELVDEVLSDRFRRWLSEGTGVDVTASRTTVGLYVFGDGDYTTVDTGKVEKALSFGLYLNTTWLREYGGAFQIFDRKAPDAEPVRDVVPIGGRCITMTPTTSTWHRIEGVDTGGEVSRLLLMAEFWRD